MTTAVPAVRNAVRTWLENFEAGDTIYKNNLVFKLKKLKRN